MLAGTLVRRGILIAAAAVVLGATLLTLPNHASGAVPLTMPSDLVQALGRQGFELSAGSPNVAASAVDERMAVAAATSLFTSVNAPVTYLGVLTVTGAHVGDESTPLSIADRAVYVVQMTGLQLYPMIGGVDPSVAHHELICFVDATTGAVLAATTVR